MPNYALDAALVTTNAKLANLLYQMQITGNHHNYYHNHIHDHANHHHYYYHLFYTYHHHHHHQHHHLYRIYV
jgi:hypothetical protein